MLPAKADPDAQARFVVEELEPRLAQARAGQGSGIQVMLASKCEFATR